MYFALILLSFLKELISLMGKQEALLSISRFCVYFLYMQICFSLFVLLKILLLLAISGIEVIIICDISNFRLQLRKMG